MEQVVSYLIMHVCILSNWRTEFTNTLRKLQQLLDCTLVVSLCTTCRKMPLSSGPRGRSTTFSKPHLHRLVMLTEWMLYLPSSWPSILPHRDHTHTPHTVLLYAWLLWLPAEHHLPVANNAPVLGPEPDYVQWLAHSLCLSSESHGGPTSTGATTKMKV